MKMVQQTMCRKRNISEKKALNNIYNSLCPKYLIVAWAHFRLGQKYPPCRGNRDLQRERRKKLITQKNHRLHFSSRIIYSGRRPPVESYPNMRHFVFSRRKKEH